MTFRITIIYPVNSNAGNYTYSISNVQMFTTAQVFRHMPPPDVNLQTVFTGYRMLGQSIRLQNNSPPIDKAGGCTGMVAAKNTCWLDYISGDIYGQINKLNKSEPKTANTGIYAFSPVNCEIDLEMRSDLIYSNGILMDSNYNPFESTTLVILAMSINDTDAQQMEVHRHVVLEATTNSQLFVTRTPTISNTACMKALGMIGKVSNFTENPNHIKSFFKSAWGWVKKGASLITKYAPVAEEIVGLF